MRSGPRRVLNGSDETVSKLRASDGTGLGTFPLPGAASSIAMVFDGNSIWVANGSSNNVSKIRASDGANLGVFPAGTIPLGIVFDGLNVWVGHRTNDQVV